MPQEHTDQETWLVDGRSIVVSHLDKVLWPNEGITKGDVLQYYHYVAPVMMRYLRDHPVVVRVFPEGIDHAGFYQRNVPNTAPAWIRTASYRPETDKDERHVPLVDNRASLLWFANRGAIEFHVWQASAERPAYPDWIVFDLDPGPRADFSRVLEAAVVLRQRLDQLGVNALPKTSGGTGLHLWAPVKPQYHVDDVRAWVTTLAQELARAHPLLFAPPDGATHDEDERITLDAAQNSLARNTAAPYTLRARPGAPVSMPLAWEEVERGTVRPEHFTLQTVPERLNVQGDAWEAQWQAGVLPIPVSASKERQRTHRRSG